MLVRLDELPGSVVETVRHESQVIFRIIAVMSRPMIGSPAGAPSATTIALATTPSETGPSTRAWLPSAISAGLDRRLPAQQANLRGQLVADEADEPRTRQHPQMRPTLRD